MIERAVRTESSLRHSLAVEPGSQEGLDQKVERALGQRLEQQGLPTQSAELHMEEIIVSHLQWPLDADEEQLAGALARAIYQALTGMSAQDDG